MDELLAEVRAARRAQKAARTHADRVKELLIQVRLQKPEMNVVEIEEKIGRFYDRATISRITSPAIKAQAEKSAGS